MIRNGMRVYIKPEWQDPGDVGLEFYACSDEDQGRVDIIPGNIGLPFPPIQTVSTYMLEEGTVDEGIDRM